MSLHSQLWHWNSRWSKLIKTCLWDGQVPSSYHTQGVRLKTEKNQNSSEFPENAALTEAVSEKGSCKGNGLRFEELIFSALSSVRQVLSNFLLTPSAALHPQIWVLQIPPNFWMKEADSENTSLPHSIPKWPQHYLFHLYMPLKILHICHILVLLQC